MSRPGYGKQKGAAFEREVCKTLSLWLSGGLRDDLLWRSAMSGGRATLAATKSGRRAQSGDISAIDEASAALINQFSIECKFYKDIALTSFLLRGEGALAGFWKQAVGDASRACKDPMLIVKQNRMEALLLMQAASTARFRTVARPLIRTDREINIYTLNQFVTWFVL